MKKRFISMALMMLLIIFLLPAAFADTTFPAPGDVEAGGSLDHLVAILSPGSSAEASGLPDGVALVTEEAQDGIYVYLRGTPSAVGSYDCSLTFTNGEGSYSLLCPVKVVPSRPSVSAGPSISCYPNETAVISVSATVADGGTLSYQWYSSSSNSSSGGTLISGAVGAEYTAGTALVGTMYYYCIVTNTNNGQSSHSVSSPISVTVKSMQVSSVAVESLPLKTEYALGDSLDPTGLSIRVYYSDGSSTVVSEGFSLSPTKLEKAGTQTIELNYQGKTCTFTVNVGQPQETIEGIGVLTLPTKTQYKQGESLEVSGLSIRVYTNLGHRDVSSGLECSPTVLDKVGAQTITVSYGGRTCTFTVDVEAEVSPVSLSVSRLPDKTSYILGESLDTTGLVLKLTDSSGQSREISSGFTCSPTKLDTLGRQEISVEYEGLDCRFNVTVTEEAEASPSPEASQSPEASPSPTDKPSRPSGGGGTSKVLAIVIVVAAILALAGLGAYIFIMDRSSDGPLSARIKELLHRLRKK